eukprot:gb/GECH01006925.1/.p1 GENE.gb/GECH01006925.1/~~gb/GECH01006925.1/.p1  ORF type:complete len:203 (+),score=12.41 gb/GECH01006925.1/:1-609(+)
MELAIRQELRKREGRYAERYIISSVNSVLQWLDTQHENTSEDTEKILKVNAYRDSFEKDLESTPKKNLQPFHKNVINKLKFMANTQQDIDIPIYIWKKKGQFRLGFEADCFELYFFDSRTLILRIGEIKRSAKLKSTAQSQLRTRIELIIQILVHFKDKIRWERLLARGIIYVPDPIAEEREYLGTFSERGVEYSIEIQRVQ